MEPRSVTCSLCGAPFPFDGKRAQRKRCDACMAPRPCAYDGCGKMFVPPQQNPTARYCSHPCALDAQRATRRALPVVESLPPPPRRGDCAEGPRPCPYPSCRYHLGPEASESCALDVADRGDATDAEIGALLSVSAARVRQIADAAMARLLSDYGPRLLRELLAERVHARGYLSPSTDDETPPAPKAG